MYSGRTPHIQVKVYVIEGENALTQLYFPQYERTNTNDSIYTKKTLVDMKDEPDEEKNMILLYLSK